MAWSLIESFFCLVFFQCTKKVLRSMQNVSLYPLAHRGAVVVYIVYQSTMDVVRESSLCNYQPWQWCCNYTDKCWLLCNKPRHSTHTRVRRANDRLKSGLLFCCLMVIAVIMLPVKLTERRGAGLDNYIRCWKKHKGLSQHTEIQKPKRQYSIYIYLAAG